MASDEKQREQWLEEIKVTFDSEELASFFEGFDPLELGEDVFPREMGKPSDS